MLKLLTTILLFFFSLEVGNANTNNSNPGNFNENYPEFEQLFEENKEVEPFNQFLDSLPSNNNIALNSIEVENSESEPNSRNNEKILTYNENSGKIIGEVSEKAVDNAKPLIPCLEVPDLCEENPEITPTPSPSEIPSPTPTDVTSPTPTEPVIPSPSIYPCPPPPCYLERDDRFAPEMPCPMYEVEESVIYPCVYFD